MPGQLFLNYAALRAPNLQPFISSQSLTSCAKVFVSIWF